MYIRKYIGVVMICLVALAGTLSPVQAVAQAQQRTTGARDIVKEIIEVVGLTPRFEMREANIENAAAVVYNGKRYILYNTHFLNAVNNAVKTDWAAVSILAHEIGHHLNGHTLSRSGSNHSDELEADEFSGFVLRKMGASLAEAQAAMAVLSEERDSYTHPRRDLRLTAISKGWHNANSQMLAVQKPVSDKPVQVKSTVRAPQPAAQHTTVASKYMLTKVNFSKLPGEEFYVTSGLNLVRVKGNQVEVIGKLAQTTDPDFPFVFRSRYFSPLFVSSKGIIYNKSGEKLGWLS
ncbi:MAG: membrane-binding protein [Hymenobacteraceae bacterium]|nr:membrane-binding protein [Hymenobacteraceae bacterium]